MKNNTFLNQLNSISKNTNRLLEKYKYIYSLLKEIDHLVKNETTTDLISSSNKINIHLLSNDYLKSEYNIEKDFNKIYNIYFVI